MQGRDQANGALCVGLKQTILFPFVTLGSLINFCDCLMAGGTSRREHSEVGSSYIHFNYTPDGDKTTASLFGDVPRGVMLNQPPIFLGGQGGAVGPLRLGYGTVIAAGSVLREDVVEDRRLVFISPPPGLQRGHSPHAYKNLNRIVRNNVAYLANLVALEEWYRSVRHSFFSRQEMGELMYAAALELLSAAKDERSKRLEAMAEKVPEVDSGSAEFRGRVGAICDLFRSPQPPAKGQAGEDFLTAFQATSGWSEGEYVATIQGLGEDLSAKGSVWLQEIVDGLCRQAGALVPALELTQTRA